MDKVLDIVELELDQDQSEQFYKKWNSSYNGKYNGNDKNGKKQKTDENKQSQKFEIILF